MCHLCAGAQIVLDAFVASGESKWLRASGLTILLPHGYDGAGPEHSSSRMERFLQMSDDHTDRSAEELAGLTNGGGEPLSNSVNWLIANPTTPANYFHLLRRQMLRAYRKPLVVVAPKTLLRHADAVSSLADMAPGQRFQPVLPDSHVTKPEQVRTVVFVSGKVYYEACAKRAELGRDDLAFIRVEELSPFPLEQLAAEVARFNNAQRFVWFQEEPANMGAWNYVAPRIQRMMREKVSGGSKHTLQYIGRHALPSPAVGAAVYHKEEVARIFKQLFQ